MARPRNSLEQADMTGQSARWTPEQRADREEAERAANAPLTGEQQDEVTRLDSLIAATMKACERGQKIRGKRNPAFQHLQLLVRARKLILDTKRKPAAESTADLLSRADALIASAAKVN